jgi:predicted DNA-binding ribbon-helix-helix protein
MMPNEVSAAELAFWANLEAVAKENHLTLAELVELIEERLGTGREFSSAIRANKELFAEVSDSTQVSEKRLSERPSV